MSEDADNKYGTYVFKNPVVMTFPKLLVAEKFKRNGKETNADPKFSANFLLDTDGEDLKTLKALAAKVARENTQADFKTLRFPFSSGDKKADERKAKSGKDDAAFNRGKIILSANTGQKYPPKLGVFPSNNQKDGLLELGADEVLIKKYAGSKNGEGWFYSGALVIPVVNLKWYPAANDDAKAGVKAYLAGVASLGIGDKLGGGGSLGSHFHAYTGHASGIDPTQGNDGVDDTAEDEIPY